MKPDKFKTYLRASGAEILEPTNPYELVRFRTRNGVSVVYQGKRGFTFTGEAREAFDRMNSKSPWTITDRGLKEKKKAKEEILKRDGKKCFYCCKPTNEENRTLEHLLSVDHGGNNHHSNLVIACQPCNSAVGSMSIIEKVRYRETLRGDL